MGFQLKKKSLRVKSKSVMEKRDQIIWKSIQIWKAWYAQMLQFKDKVHWQYLRVSLFAEGKNNNSVEATNQNKEHRYSTSWPLGMWSWDVQKTAPCWKGYWSYYILQAHWIPVLTENVESFVNQSVSIPEDGSRCVMKEDRRVILVEM